MFVEKDFTLLGEVFSLARVQTVNSDPQNRTGLENMMNFEVILKGKMDEVNKELGEDELKKETGEKDVDQEDIFEEVEDEPRTLEG